MIVYANGKTMKIDLDLDNKCIVIDGVLYRLSEWITQKEVDFYNAAYGNPFPPQPQSEATVSAGSKVLIGRLPAPESPVSEKLQATIGKDYEILCFDFFGEKWKLESDGQYHIFPDGVGWGSDYLLGNSNYKIYSVKRISDGKIFEIGQEVETIYESKYTIDSFYLEGDRLFIMLKNKLGNNSANINQISKKPTTVDDELITDDGVKIGVGPKHEEEKKEEVMVTRNCEDKVTTIDIAQMVRNNEKSISWIELNEFCEENIKQITEAANKEFDGWQFGGMLRVIDGIKSIIEHFKPKQS
jgi:hypothetical protein